MGVAALPSPGPSSPGIDPLMLKVFRLERREEALGNGIDAPLYPVKPEWP
jgi:hypothetical protein